MNSSGHQFPLHGARHAGYFKSHFSNPDIYENGVPAVALFGYATEALLTADHTIHFETYRSFYLARFLRTSFGSDFEFAGKLHEGCAGWQPHKEHLPFVFDIVYHCDPQTAALVVTGGDRLLLHLFSQYTQQVVRSALPKLPGGNYGTTLVAMEPHNRVFSPDLHAHIRPCGACVIFHKSIGKGRPLYEWSHVARPRLPRRRVQDITADLRKAELRALEAAGYRISVGQDHSFQIQWLSADIPAIIRMRHYAAAVAAKALTELRRKKKTDGPGQKKIEDRNLDAVIGELYAVANAAGYLRTYTKLALPQPIAGKISRDAIGPELCANLDQVVIAAITRTKRPFSLMLSGPRVLPAAKQVAAGAAEGTDASPDPPTPDEVSSHRDFGPQTLVLRDRRDNSPDPLAEFQADYPDEADDVACTVQMVILVLEGLAREAIVFGHPIHDITAVLKHCGQDTLSARFASSAGGMRKVRHRLRQLAKRIVQVAFANITEKALLQRGAELVTHIPFEQLKPKFNRQERLFLLWLLRELNRRRNRREYPGSLPEAGRRPPIPRDVPLLMPPHWNPELLWNRFLQQDAELDRKLNDLVDPPQPPRKKPDSPPNRPPTAKSEGLKYAPPSGAKQTASVAAPSAAATPPALTGSVVRKCPTPQFDSSAVSLETAALQVSPPPVSAQTPSPTPALPSPVKSDAEQSPSADAAPPAAVTSPPDPPSVIRDLAAPRNESPAPPLNVPRPTETLSPAETTRSRSLSPTRARLETDNPSDLKIIATKTDYELSIGGRTVEVDRKTYLVMKHLFSTGKEIRLCGPIPSTNQYGDVEIEEIHVDGKLVKVSQYYETQVNPQPPPPDGEWPDGWC